MTIRPIAPAQTYALRHAVLWPDKPLDYVKLADDDTGQHFGAFDAENLVAVISLFISPDGMARFRKFATDPAWQGRGIGSALLQHTLAAAAGQRAHAIWCDARHNTLSFYERFGLRPEGDVFYKGSLAYVRLQRPLP